MICTSSPTLHIVSNILDQAESHPAFWPRCPNAKIKILISSIIEELIATYWSEYSNTCSKMPNKFPVCAMYEGTQFKLAAAELQMAPKGIK